MQIKSDKLRVFFALWPEPEVRDKLQVLADGLVKSCAGRVMRAETLHVTLLFLGEIARERLPGLMQAAGRVQGTAVEMALDHVAGWRHNRIVYVAPSAPVEMLDELIRDLRREVLSAGFSVDRREFSPHVTLLRNVRQIVDGQTVPAIAWHATSFALVESMLTAGGSRYRVIGVWPLTGHEAVC